MIRIPLLRMDVFDWLVEVANHSIAKADHPGRQE